MARLLVVDGSPDSVTELSDVLGASGFDVQVAASASEAIRLASTEHFDLVLLELELPDGSGEHVLHTVLRARPGAQVVAITEAGEVGRRIGALEMGAVDVVARPFAGLELVARIRTRLRMAAAEDDTVYGDVTAPISADQQLQDVQLVAVPEPVSPASEFRAPLLPVRQLGGTTAVRGRAARPPIAGSTALAYDNDLWLDTVRRRLVARGREVDLSQREFVLMSHLIRHRGEVCTRRQLLADVWGVDFEPRTNVVDVYIRRLRQKLDQHAIDTVHNVGYRLVAG